MTIKNVLESLNGTNSTNEKIEILKKNKDNKLLKSLFYHTYNPFFNYYIKKVPIVKTVGKYTLDEHFESYESILRLLIDRKVTGHAALNLVSEFLETFDKESQDIITMSIKRDLRINIGDKVINKVWKDLIPTFEVQLANKFADILKKNKVENEYFASPKLDGLRGMYIIGRGLYTRQGKRIIGFEDTIEKACEKICSTAKVGAIDGELYSDKIPFEDIQGSVMRNKNIDKEDKEKIYFNVFAFILDFAERKIFNTTKEMVGSMRTHIRDEKYIKLVEQLLIDKKEIDTLHDKYAGMGYEGLMLRSVKVSYSFKRDNNLLKYKKFLESDFIVESIFEGTGKYINKLGGIKIKGKVDGKTIISECGSGFDDAQREEYWKNNIVGKKVEIKYQGVTPDNSLRFPIFLKLKLDR